MNEGIRRFVEENYDIKKLNEKLVDIYKKILENVSKPKLPII